MRGWSLSRAGRYAAATGFLAASALSGIIYMSPAEFAHLQSLPNAERRARLGMPDTCRPRLTAVKPSARPSGRIAVHVSCQKRLPDARPGTPTPGRQ
jgi:hypothetical protein